MPSLPKLTEVLPPGLPAQVLLSAIIASSDDAIVSQALDGTITSWNPAAELIFGFEAEEALGTSVFRLIPPELHAEQHELLARIRAGERIAHFETRRCCRDGRIIFVSLSLSPVQDESGEVTGVASIARDVTEQRAAATARSWLAALVDSSDDAIISKDLNGTITSWNKAATRIFGYQPAEIIGQSVLRLIPPELHGDEDIILGRLRRGQRIDHFETVRVRKDGRRLRVSLTISPIADDSGRLVGASKIARDITGEHEAEITRRRMAAIVDSSDDAIIAKDLRGIIQTWNRGAERIFGYTAAEVVGQPITVLMRPEEAREEPRILAQISRGERIDHYETIRRRKDGSLINVSLTISAIRDTNGEVIGASKIARDVTRQRSLEREREQLLEQEQAARAEAEALMEAARSLSADLDLASAAQKATDIATRLTGAKFGAFFYHTVNEREESYVLYALAGVPRPVFEKFGLPRNPAIFSPTFHGESVVRLADVTADPRYGRNAPDDAMSPGQLPVRSYLAVSVISRTGEVIGGLYFGHPDPGVFDERAERVAVGIAAQTAIAVDNARLYARVQQVAERLNYSLSALELGDWTWNAATDEMRMSLRAAEMFGLPAGEAGKRDLLRERIHPDDRERARHAAWASRESGRDYFAEYRINHPTQGERWILAKGRAQRDEQGAVTGMMGVVQDITDRKLVETQIQRHAEILEQHVAERTARLQETIGELEAFSYSVSHDMRTPLRAMAGYAERLLRLYRSQLDQDAVHYLERINYNARRLELLVRDVLAYSRVSKAEIELGPVDLEKFLDALLPTLPDLQKPGVTLEIQRPLPRIMGHEAYLSQVFSNLLSNALKFAAERSPRIVVKASRLNDNVSLQVCDNGIGIAEEHFERIFQIFGRVYPDKKFEGTGIGLSIVKKAVQRMGGQVSVQSRLGEGTCFTIELPAA